jgi:hypothetical protein
LANQDTRDGEKEDKEKGFKEIALNVANLVIGKWIVPPILPLSKRYLKCLVVVCG